MNEIEEKVVKRAIEVYRDIVEEKQMTKKILEAKKFKLNDYVVCTSNTYFDQVFGTTKKDIAKVVGFDKDYNWYRIRYDERNSYIGVKEEELKLYDGDISEIDDDLLNYDANKISYIHGFKI